MTFGGGSTAGGGAGGSWGPAQPTTPPGPSRVNLPGYGGTALVAGGAAPLIATQSVDPSEAIPSIDTPYGPVFQGTSDAELGALGDAQSGAILYRFGTTGENAAGEGQFWSFSNPATFESSEYRQMMGMLPAQADSTGYPFIVSGRLTGGANAITRFSPAFEGSGVGGTLEVVVENVAEDIEILAFGTL